MVEKLEDYLYRLFEINITDMGYEPRLIPKGEENNFDVVLNDEEYLAELNKAVPVELAKNVGESIIEALGGNEDV